MAVYEYECSSHGGRFYATFPMGTAPGFSECESCGGMGTRCFTAPNFTEDRTRFFRNANGTKYSQSLGTDMPDSKKERDAMARARGIEFIGPCEAPDHVRRAAEYGRHLKSGGERIDNGAAEAMMSPPKPHVDSVLERLRKGGKRLGDIPTDRPLPGVKLPSFPKDVNL